MNLRHVVIFACVISFPAGAQTSDAFATNVYPVFQRANCRSCHVEGGLAGSTRLRFPPADATADAINEFGRGLVSLVDRQAPEQSVLLRKPTNRQKHTGGELIKPGGREDAALLAWIRKIATAGAGATVARSHTPEQPAWPKLRRLTHSQYNNTVRDLLGDDSRPADRFPPEDYVNGFKNQITAQDISPLLAEAYNLAAERLAKAAFHGGVDDRKIIPCAPTSHSDAQCRAAFVRSFGLRAFRRPLSASEQSRYEQVFQKAADASRSFASGAQLVVEAMLQSPKFLYQSEGASIQNRAWSVASRLSYFLWDTMPDEGLFNTAASGKLLTPAVLKATIQRMLTDARAQQGLNEFISQWLRFDFALGAVKDRAVYPQFTPELAASMAEETRLLISDIVRQDRSFMDVFTSAHTFVSSDLAAIYGLQAPAAEFAKVSLPAESGRAGIVGQALFLALTSKPGETSPTVRGSFVREHFLCQQVPDPPPGTNANLPPLTESKPQTTRERLSEHTTNASCRGCHNLMDPIGFGLEGFDAIGRRRDKQRLTFTPDRLARGKKAVSLDLPLDVRGVVDGIPNSEFKSPAELGRLLSDSAQCQECIVRQVFRYAFGRRETDADRAQIERAASVFRESGFRMRALMAYLGEVLASPEGTH